MSRSDGVRHATRILLTRIHTSSSSSSSSAAAACNGASMQTAAAAARTAAVSRPLDAIIRRVLNLAARSPTAAHSAAAVPSSSLFSSSFSSSSAASPVSTPSAFSNSRALVFGCSGGAGGGACAVTRAGGRGRAAGACAGAGAVNLDNGGLRWLKTSAGRVRAVGAKAKVGAGAGAGAVHVDIGARARARQTQRMWTLGCPARSVQRGPFSGGGGVSAASQPSQHRCFLHCHTSSHLPFSPQPTPPPLHQILVRFRGALPDLFREGHSVVAEGFLRPLSEANTAAFTGSSIASASSSSGFSGRGATVLGVAEAEGAVVERGIGEGGARGEGGGVGEKGVGEWEEGEDVSASARSVGYFFAATEVLAKHDEKYMPKEVAAALEKNRAAIEAAGEEDTSDGEGEGKDDGERSVGEAQKGKKSSVGSGGAAAGSAAALGMGDGAKKPGKLSKLGQSPSVAQGYDIPS
ncbi:unnamed protein product [Closterium sp. NIES-54]